MCKQWSAPEWRRLGFEASGTERYRYGYRSTPTTFEAIAVGDSDCDGDEVTLTLPVRANDGGPRRDSIQRTGDD